MHAMSDWNSVGAAAVDVWLRLDWLVVERGGWFATLPSDVGHASTLDRLGCAAIPVFPGVGRDLRRRDAPWRGGNTRIGFARVSAYFKLVCCKTRVPFWQDGANLFRTDGV